MALLAYNRTGAPVTLAAGNPARTLPASLAPPAHSEATNVTGELHPDLTVDPALGRAGGLTAANFASLQVQVAAGTVLFEWSDSPEYATATLVVAGVAPGAHAPTHKTAGGTDVLVVGTTSAAVSSDATGISASGASHTHTSGATTFIRHDVFKLPNATGTVIIAAEAKGTGGPKVVGTNPNCPRTVQIVTDGTWVATDDVVVTVNGVSVRGSSGMYDTITIPANSAAGSTFVGVVPFLSITDMAWTAPAGWTAGTIEAQAGTKLGLVDPTGAAIGALKEVGYVDATPAPAHATLGTIDIANSTYVPTTALNGTNDVEVWWSSIVSAAITGGTAVSVTVTDAGHTHSSAAHGHNVT
jgi:hypothetical protein